jgi:hypothetical protein
MLFISHRGNLIGPDLGLENSEEYILAALAKGFDVEVDIWRESNDDLYLGHDKPAHKTILDFLTKNREKLWIHCKNLCALNFFLLQDGFNFFWHESDDYTLTSKGFIWTYFDKPVMDKNVIVIKGRPDKENLPKCFGICSDFVEVYK